MFHRWLRSVLGCAVVALASVASAQSDLNTGLVAYYPFDGNANDLSGAGRHGTAYSGVTYAPGVIGQAADFNGINAYIKASSDGLPTGERTVSLWFFSRAIGMPRPVFMGYGGGGGCGTSWFLMLDREPAPPFYLSGHCHSYDLWAPYSQSPVGAWYHLVVSTSAAGTKFYVNGEQVSSSSYFVNNTTVIPGRDLTIGVDVWYQGIGPYTDANVGYFNGLMDELRIHNRALTDLEVLQLYRQGTVSLSITPKAGGDTGIVSVNISGTGFLDGAVVKLARGGESDIAGNDVKVTDGGMTLRTRLDLTARKRGPWDVVVTNPNGKFFTLKEGFTVEEGRAATLSVNLLGLPVIRPNRAQDYWIVVSNSGNTDAPEGHVFLDAGSNLTIHSANNGTPVTLSPSSQLHVAVVDMAPKQPRYIPISVTAASAEGVQGLRATTAATPMGMRGGVTDAVGGIIVAGYDAAQPSARSRRYPPQNVPDDYERRFPANVSRCGDAPAGYKCEFDIVDPATGTLIERQSAMKMGDGTVCWAIGVLGHPPNQSSCAPLTDIYNGAFDSDRAKLTDTGAKRPFYGFGLQNDGQFIPQDQLDTAVRDACTPHLGRPYCSGRGDRTAGCISCIGYYLACYENLLNIFDTKDYFTVGWSKEYRQGGTCRDKNNNVIEGKCQSNTSVSAEFDRNNSIWYFFEPVATSIDDLWYSILKALGLVFSFDPNDKSGLVGHSTRQYIPGQIPLAYSISFENRPDATAPAQEVVITDRLNVTQVDLETLSFGPITFGTHSVIPPSGAKNYLTDVDLGGDSGLHVRVIAESNSNTGVLTWRFTAVDPTTGRPPADPLKGFLPANVNPPEGSGSVLFSVLPRTLETGTEIRNKAEIVFDTNAPIVTSEWLNTIDRTAPQSHVLPLPATQASTDIALQWAGADEGAGIKSYTIFLSQDGESFTPLYVDTATTSATFRGEAGHSYAFYCLGRDWVGNVEGAKTTAEATSRIVVSDTTPPMITPVIAGTGGSNGWYKGEVVVSWSLSDPESGIASSGGCAEVTLNVETEGRTFTCSASNGAGLSNSNTVTVKIDNTAPSVSLAGGPANGGSYYFGSVPAAPACSASDPLSGLDGGCRVSGYSTVVGTHAVTAVATDKAGNQATASVSYTVLPWTLRGFYQPVDMAGVWNQVRGGATVPLKFEVFDGTTEVTDPSIVKSLAASQAPCAAGASDVVDLTAIGGTSLRYDWVSGQFIYNWQTPKRPGVCYLVTVTLADGSSATASFQLK